MHPRFKISLTHLGILGFGDSMREYSLLVLWVKNTQQELCKAIMLVRYDGPQMNQTLVPAIASHTPAGITN